ncbi:MAG: tetratricopeptide repeat protein, partial [Sphingobacteriales bacterium]
YAYQASISSLDAAETYLSKAQGVLDTAMQLDVGQVNQQYIQATIYNMNLKRLERANLAFGEKDYDTAYGIYSKLSDQLPKDSTLAINTAITANFLQRRNDAFKYMKRSADLNVHNPGVYQFLGNWHEARQETDLAIQAFENGLKYNPGNLALNNEYLNVLINNSRFTKVLSAIDIALKANPDDERLYYLLGYVHQQRGNFTESKSAFEKAIALNNYFFDAYYQLGILYLAKPNNPIADNGKAQIALQRAYDIKPNDKQVIRLLIQINEYYKRGDVVQNLRRRLNEL